jgi:type III restriction enzyme
LEDYIVHALVDFDDVDYFSHAELLYDLAGQMVAHLRRYLSESEARNVLDRDRRLIAREIHAQMVAHFWERATEYEVQVSRGFTELRPCTYTLGAGQVVRNVRDTVDDPARIKQMLFGGFQRCLYPLQKFDSGTERRFALILEREALRWFKPAKGQFQIYYKLGTEQPEYVPDFVAETADAVWMVETKARDEMFAATDTSWAPWYVARSEDKKRVRLNVISHLLKHVPYKASKTEKVRLPKRKIGRYKAADYPYKYVEERF